MLYKILKNHDLRREKKELLRSWSNNYESSRKAIATFSKINDSIKHYDVNKFVEINYLREVLNSCLYIIIVLQDNITLSSRLLISDNDWEKKLSARHLVVCFVDLFDKIIFFLGKKLPSKLEAHSDTRTIAELKAISKEFSKIKNSNDKYLRDIRNTIIAHKAVDSFSLLDGINNIDSYRILNMGIEINETSIKFINVITRFLVNVTPELKKILHSK